MMNSVSKKKNIVFIDLAKGMAIFLVVLGHALKCLPETTPAVMKQITSLIYLIHMPLFFVIAGMLFELNKPRYETAGLGTFLKKKGQLYLVPYVSFSLLLYVMVNVCSNIHGLETVMEKIANPMNFREFLWALFTYENHMDGHLWFSYVMFFVLAIAFLLIHIPDKWIMIELYAMYTVTFYFAFPEVVWKVMRYLFLFYVGKELYRNWCKIEKIKLVYYAFVFVATYGGYLLLKTIENPAMGFLKPVSEVTSACIILILLSRINNKRLVGILDRLGKESYVIYLLHQPYIVPVVMTLLGKSKDMSGIGIIISTVLGIVIPIMANDHILKKIRILNFCFLGGH